MHVKLVATCKLVVDPEQKSTLVDLMARFNDACNWLAAKAFELKSADKYKLQKLHDEIRSTFGLHAQFRRSVSGTPASATVSSARTPSRPSDTSRRHTPMSLGPRTFRPGLP